MTSTFTLQPHALSPAVAISFSLDGDTVTTSEPKSDIVAAHKHCGLHRAEILHSDRCGCFYCLAIFQPSEIEDWVDEPPNVGISASGKSALCPRCGIDSVIGSSSGYPITVEFLTRMKEHWF
jgi:hypothetical protein